MFGDMRNVRSENGRARRQQATDPALPVVSVPDRGSRFRLEVGFGRLRLDHAGRARNTRRAGAVVLATAVAATFAVSGCTTTTPSDQPTAAAKTPAASERQSLPPTTSATPHASKSPTTSHHKTTGSVTSTVGAILPN